MIGVIIISITEFGFSVDEFNNPKTYKEAEAICVLLVRLLLLEPGTIQSHPNMGVGIVSRYRYSMDGSANTLKTDFQNQIATYLPQFQGAQVSITEGDNTYYISVQIDDRLYGIEYDTTNSKVRYAYKNINEL